MQGKVGRGKLRATAVALLAALVLVTTVGPARASDDDHRFATDAGYGVGAFFTNILYMPVKFVYATIGGITGGFAYLLTGLRYDIAKGIWVPSMGGTYVVTPSMLRGEDPIYFSGTTEPKHEHERASHEEEDLGTTGGKTDPPGTKY
jgi:hypothetical protein